MLDDDRPSTRSSRAALSGWRSDGGAFAATGQQYSHRVPDPFLGRAGRAFADWRARVVDEFADQQGLPRKSWWVLRFALCLLTTPIGFWTGGGGWSFGIAALGDNNEKARRAIAKAKIIQETNREKRESGG